jgi:hypothetical protein
MSNQERFETYLKGTWKMRWWNVFAPASMRLLDVTSYSTGHVTEKIRAVQGRTDDGTRFEVTVNKDATGIPGWKKLTDVPE